MPDLAQVEGYSTADGRGVSIWDTFSATPGKVFKGETGTALYGPLRPFTIHGLLQYVQMHPLTGLCCWSVDHSDESPRQLGTASPICAPAWPETGRVLQVDLTPLYQ